MQPLATTIGWPKAILFVLIFAGIFLSSCSSPPAGAARETASYRKSCSEVIAKTEKKNVQNALLSTADFSLSPWSDWKSEKAYVYLGATPREMIIEKRVHENPQIPLRLKAFGESELTRIKDKLGLKSAEFELYPAYDGWGALTWAIGRYRRSPKEDWKWLDERVQNPEFRDKASGKPGILLPKKLQYDNGMFFDEVPVDLYQRPLYPNTLWVSQGGRVEVAWPGTEQKKNAEALSSLHEAIQFPPPARLNDEAISFVARVSDKGVEWPSHLAFVGEKKSRPQTKSVPKSISTWPKDFDKKYLKRVREFSEGAPVDFKKQSSGQPDNQLLKTAAYLRKLHEEMGFGKIPGFEIEEQEFEFNGIPQKNVIFKIKGRRKGKSNNPVVFSGHYDKAIAEDTFEKANKRETTPGADDNGTAIAALISGAEVLMQKYQDQPPENDIWFVHFTGEEYPANCLGARYFVSKLLEQKQDISANVNLDMLGHRTVNDTVFQINPGNSDGSKKVAELARNVALGLSGEYLPVVREPWSKSSYVTQTDSEIFDRAGFPTILINEHINLKRRVNPHYHQSTDLAEHIDLPYAIVQTKTAIETVAQLSEQK